MTAAPLIENEVTVRPQGWACGCKWYGRGVMPHHCGIHNQPPLIEWQGATANYKPADDLDVVAALDAQKARDLKCIDYVVNAAIWFVCGMLIMGAICLVATTKH